MKKQRPTRLTLTRETVVQLTEEKLRELRGGTGSTGSFFICPPNQPYSYVATIC